MSTSKPGRLVVVGIVCLGAVMTLVGSLESSPKLEPVPLVQERSLTSAEQAYLAFMAPRLDRLIVETTSVSSLVDERSRNIIALRGHGNRITVLTTDIIGWDDDKEVPAEFVPSHELLLTTAGQLNALIDEAEGALLRFDFAGIGDMIPRFDSAVAAAQTVRNTLPLAGDSPWYRKLVPSIVSDARLLAKTLTSTTPNIAADVFGCGGNRTWGT